MSMPLWTSSRTAVDKPDGMDSAPAAALSKLEQIFFMNPLREVYTRVQNGGPGILERLLREMRIAVKVTGEDLARIPQSGAALVVANHPFGILDGAALGAVLLRIRADVKILTNYVIAAMPELNEYCIYVDPFDRPASHRANITGLRRAVTHLRNGGLLAIFPAGEVSHWQFRQGEVTDGEWNTIPARLVRLSGAPVIPALFAGRNSNLYQMLGVVHPKLRTIQLPREFLNKAGKEIDLRFGTPILAEKINRFVDDRQATNYLRWRTYLLRRRMRSGPPAAPAAEAAPALSQGASSPERNAIVAEIGALGPAAELDENRDFKVLVASAAQIPHGLKEIGRQRELAFREVGEGTGKEIDLDQFDSY